MRRKVSIIFLVFLLIQLPSNAILANQEFKINANGHDIKLGKWLIIEEGTTYIPFSLVANLLDLGSSFDETNKSVTFQKGNTKLWVQASNKTVIINDIKIGIDKAPKMIHNTLYVPLKFTFDTLGVSVGWDEASNSVKINSSDIKNIDKPVKELLKEPLPAGYTQIQISAAGDCTLGFDDKFSKTNRFDSVLKEKGGDYSYFFKNVKHIFEMDDMTIVNLENPLTNATSKASKQFAFKGRPEYTQILKEGSVEAVNLSNNHTYDYKEQGMRDTITHLKNANIIYFGNGNKAIKTIKGIKTANLGYNGWSNNKNIKEQIKKDIVEMRKVADLVIVTFHWGIERANYPNNIQKDLGRWAIDQGADLVLGHHPHVMQGIEEYKGKQIVYSLANFCFGGNRNPADKDTFIYQQSFTFNENKQLVAKRFNVIPCTVSSVNYRNDYCPTPQGGARGQKIINRLKQYSSVFPKPAAIY
ncbi:MAG: CapA family protein [Epulopiscium sp.]|nr:CapA family protein [Candidatus Epulonipiscium sp.]